LWRDAGCSGELREPHAVLLEVLEDLRVGGSQIVEALLGQPLEQGRSEGFISQAKHDPGVPPA